ncbi:MAG: rod shape-determining protein MreC [Bacteroidota bacterium]
MYRLLSFLGQFRNLILFLLLEGIALFLVVNFNDHQRHRFGDWVLDTTSGFHKTKQEVKGYFYLKTANEELKVELQNYYSQIDSLNKELHLTKGLLMRDSLRLVDSVNVALLDSLGSFEQHSFLPARAIKHTVNRSYNYLTINKGSVHGVERGMGVISPKGIAGVVIRVSKNYCLALSALNVGFKLSIKVKPSNQIGTYSWQQGDYKEGYLNFLPLTASLDTGNLVVTSGNSTIFPPGFPVGKVSEMEQDLESGFYEAKVKLTTDFRSLSHVFLVKVQYKAEIDSLEVNLPQE